MSDDHHHIGTGPPYRAPCAGWDGTKKRYKLVNCAQNKDPDAEDIPVFTNTTMVPSFECDGVTLCDPPTITPYPRSDPDNFGPCTGTGCGANVGAWPLPIPDNTFMAAGTTIDLSVCHKVGFKYVVATKFWHGRFGFTDPDGCCTGAEPPLVTTPSNTKYLTMTRNSTITWSCESGAITGTRIVNKSYSVDRYSGIVTETSCSDTVTGDTGFECDIGQDGSPETDMINGVCFCNNLVFGGDSGDAWDAVWTPGYTPLPSETVSRSVTNTAVNLHYNNNTGPTVVDIVTAWTLSDPYTGDDLNADVDAMLSTWDLTDDITYPWRTDLLCTTGPYLQYDEKSPSSPDVTFAACGFTDTSPATGALLGAPLPAGYDRFFDFRHQSFQWDPSFGTWDSLAFGAWSTNPNNAGNGYPGGIGWPPNATQWTNETLAQGLLPYAFMTSGEGAMTKSKYAEILIPTRSHNFARPCGATDQAARDQTEVVCTDGVETNPGDLRWPDAPCFCNDPSQTTDCDTPADPSAVDEWNDEGVKGDYVTVEWQFDKRNLTDDAPTVTVTKTQRCTSYSNCRPSIIFITPNGESSELGVTIDMPSLTPDDCYGTLWQSAVVAWMPDPFWQAPAKPCDLDGGTEWREDDGTCKEDGTDPDTGNPVSYFPLRPYEEARLTVPPGAPALPDGITLPTFDAIPNPGTCFLATWAIYLNEQACIAAGGRFADIYDGSEDYPEDGTGF